MDVTRECDACGRSGRDIHPVGDDWWVCDACLIKMGEEVQEQLGLSDERERDAQARAAIKRLFGADG